MRGPGPGPGCCVFSASTSLAESLARFASLPAPERRKIVFTHLNNTNPAADPQSAARRQIEAAGMRVAAEGERIEL